MRNNKDEFFFNNLISTADLVLNAANLLNDTLQNFKREELEERVNKMHEIEVKGDKNKYDMSARLMTAFVTPIERSDIIRLNQNIDNMIDTIENVLIYIFVNNINDVIPEAKEYAELIVKCCTCAKNGVCEFKNFKRSKTLQDHIQELYRTEEEGDKLYIKSIKDLHERENDIYKLITWREIFGLFKKCGDAIESVGINIEGATIRNS